MRNAIALVAAFAGWGVFGAFVEGSSPGLAFIIGLAVGAGSMLAASKGK